MFLCYFVKIKMVVGEIAELDRISESKTKNGFHAFMWQAWARLNHDTGRLERDLTPSPKPAFWFPHKRRVLSPLADARVSASGEKRRSKPPIPAITREASLGAPASLPDGP